MPRKKRNTDADARNRGVEKRGADLSEPARHPPRERVHGKGSAGNDSAERDPASPEHLENPPQVEGPRERLNQDSGAEGVE